VRASDLARRSLAHEMPRPLRPVGPRPGHLDVRAPTSSDTAPFSGRFPHDVPFLRVQSREEGLQKAGKGMRYTVLNSWHSEIILRDVILVD
jgi:hypothetical protein